MGLMQQKLRASGIHLAISLVFLLSFLSFVYFILYTPEIMRLEGGQRIVLIVFGLGLALGPMMTAILYRKGKWGMMFDLVTVGLLQFSAFAYGGWTLYSQRPVYVAFIKEHFEVIPLGSIDLKELKDASLDPGLARGPQFVYVEPPGGEAAQEVLWQALTGGKDLHLLPEYYRQLDRHLEPVRARGISLETLRKAHEAAAQVVAEALRQLGRTEEEVMLLPVTGKAAEGAVLLDRATGALIDYLDVVIW